jgi:hypothetical protein
MNNTTKEREEFIVGAKSDFDFTHNENSKLSKLNLKLIEDCITSAMANIQRESRKSPCQVTIFADRDIAGVFQILTVPLVGDEITIHNRNGREQVYEVIKVRHSAYFSATKIDDSAKSNAVIWCKLIQNPVKVGLIF